MSGGQKGATHDVLCMDVYFSRYDERSRVALLYTGAKSVWVSKLASRHSFSQAFAS